MKQLFTSFLLVIGFSLAAETIYVSPTGSASGAGTHWDDPTSLTRACTQAQYGDRIFVMSGTYVPGQTSDATFTIKPGVQLYGGFAGHEVELEERNVAAAPSILSGNIGNPNSREDNVHTVVTMIAADDATILDGFTISGGEALGFKRDFGPLVAGAGLFITGSTKGQGPQIVNCVFTQNQARYGGAVFVDGSQHASNPIFSGCRFVDNKADIRGGAVYNYGENGAANPIVEGCSFSDNKSGLGACLFNDGTSGESSPLITNCRFVNNHALSDGAVLYDFVESGSGRTDHILNGCDIRDNDSHLGNDRASNRKVILKSQTANATQGGTLHSIDD